jgi:hypothetical protein
MHTNTKIWRFLFLPQKVCYSVKWIPDDLYLEIEWPGVRPILRKCQSIYPLLHIYSSHSFDTVCTLPTMLNLTGIFYGPVEESQLQ